MGEYLFRFPTNMPALTFATLEDTWRIGRTVEIEHGGPSHDPYTTIILYHTTIAVLRPDRILFPRTRDRHQATREWLQQIIRNNGLGTSVYRNRKGDLVIDGERPVEGFTYAVHR